MIDNHLSRPGLQPHEAKEAYFRSFNQSSGPAFHGDYFRRHDNIMAWIIMGLLAFGLISITVLYGR